jgi:hypothetical protein
MPPARGEPTAALQYHQDASSPYVLVGKEESMKHHLARLIPAIMTLAVLAIPSRLAAAPPPPQYVGIDQGTLGGSYAYVDTPATM